MTRHRLSTKIEDAGLSLLCAGAFLGFAALVLAQEIAARIGGRK